MKYDPILDRLYSISGIQRIELLDSMLRYKRGLEHAYPENIKEIEDTQIAIDTLRIFMLMI